MDMTQTLLPIKQKPISNIWRWTKIWILKEKKKKKKKKSSPCYALHTKLALVIFGCRENTEGESRMLRFQVKHCAMLVSSLKTQTLLLNHSHGHLLYSVTMHKKCALEIRETSATSQISFLIMSREFQNFQKTINIL